MLLLTRLSQTTNQASVCEKFSVGWFCILQAYTQYDAAQTLSLKSFGEGECNSMKDYRAEKTNHM